MRQEDLIVGKEYYLVYTGQFCHRYTSNGNCTLKEGNYTFVGCIDSSGRGDTRNIFFNLQKGYVMFGTDGLEYIVDEDFVKLKTFVEDNSISDETIKKLLND